MTNGQIELRDLVVLRVIGIKVILSVKARVSLDLAVERKAYEDRQLRHLAVEPRQRPWHAKAGGTY